MAKCPLKMDILEGKTANTAKKWGSWKKIKKFEKTC